jgi:putative adenylate-forming enzyme
VNAAAIGRSWLTTRLAMAQDAEGLAARRARLWRAFQPVMRRTPALAAHAEASLDRVPIVEVAELRADYGRWNSRGLSHTELHAAAADAERGGSGEVRLGVVCGYSTGSSGARGLFVADRAERADYIGQIFARLLPVRTLLKPMRVALMLRANSRLYSDSAGAGRAFLHLPLETRRQDAAAALERFAPTVLIAPGSRLMELLDHGSGLPALQRLFYGADPMSDAERAWIHDRSGLRADPIYQATEGFIGAPCAEGRLHLNEHSLSIELEPVAGTQGYRPVVTDLRRRTQPIVRVRTDDYLELDPTPCRCGYAGRVVRPIMGRVTDIWRYGNVTVTPPLLAACMDAIIPLPVPWQAFARRDHVELRLGTGVRTATVADALRRRLDLPVPVRLSDTPPEQEGPKRRWMVGHG